MKSSIQEVLVHLEVAGEGVSPLIDFDGLAYRQRSVSPLKAEELQALLVRASSLIKDQAREIASLKRSVKERDDMFRQFAGGMKRQQSIEGGR